MALTETQRKVMDLIRTETGTMAYTYEQAKQIVEAVRMYIDVNIDDVAGDDIGEMTLNAITALLDRKIQQYSKYKRGDKPGVYLEKTDKQHRKDMIESLMNNFADWNDYGEDPVVIKAELELMTTDALQREYSHMLECIKS